MKNLNSREKLLLTLVLLLGILYFYMKFFLNPIFVEISKTKLNISTSKVQLNNIKNISLSNKKLIEQRSELENKLNDALKALPLSARNPEVTYDINQLADKNNVTIENISFGKTNNYTAAMQSNNTGANNQISSTNNVMYLPATLSVSGDYPTILSFISSIEKSTRIAELDSVEFTGAGKTLKANISVNFYFVMNGKQDNYDYDFNKGNYGKDNLFN